MNKSFTIQCLKKTGLTICLFLCVTVCSAQQNWLADDKLKEAYALALNLKLEESRKLIPQTETPQHIYLNSLTEVIELLLTEDEEKLDRYEEALESRISKLEKMKPVTDDVLFTLAELRLQWAFVYLKFGEELDAAWNVKQAYVNVQKCKKKFPGFTLIHKASGTLEVMLGSIPEKYQWITGMFGMSGSVDKGLRELQSLKDSDSDLNFETALLYYLTQAFILQQTSVAVTGLDELIAQYPDQKLALFLGGCLAIKNAESEKALGYFKTLQQNSSGLPIAYADYQTGEVYLHKGEYDLSIESYQKFLSAYSGMNYVKDANYKIGICYWLQGKKKDAKTYFEKAEEEGNESTEADRHASRSLDEGSFPNIKLSKIRYATDGGYYEKAEAIVATVTEKDLLSKEEKVEFVYRQARLFHKQNEIVKAKNFYISTIEKAGTENWYFAPNACLQIGYIFSEEDNAHEAKRYFEKALTYKKHEYKNSIDSKAKSALARLKK